MRTKLFQPALRPSVIARPQLVERLNAALSPDRASFATRLTLISAPAGFGKTTLVSAWLAQLATTKRHFPGVQAAWLSLDSGDNDLVRFLAYVIAALRLVVPGAGSAAEPFLLSPQTPAPEMILTLLINDLSQNDQLMVLVLDDYDAISLPAIHQALAFLLDHLPPSLHVLITTRSDPPLPLSRLRARCQMIEIRAADLRFTPGEARLFLTQALGLPLADEDMAALETRAEGWIAGLQLVALSMQGHDSPPDFIRAFAGSHRYILDYLTEEVLERRPAGTKDFLLRTSILNRLCGPLCDAITGQAEGQVILERLEHANLFLTPLDEERHWYRYHQLFAEVLRRRLQQEQPGIVPHLHQQASAWLEQHGLLHEAVNHALAGNDYERAASLIERVHGAKWQSGEIRTLQDWLAALPEASWRAHPRLWLVQAWAAMTVGAFAEADEHLHGAEAALDRLDAPAARSLRPEVTAFRASYASLVQDPSAVPLAQQALQELPGDYWMRGMLVVFLGAAYYVMGDLDSALAVLAQAPGAGPPAVDAPLQPHQIHLLAFGGMVHHARGQLRMAWSRIQQALALAEPGGKPIPFVGTLLAYMAASLVLYEQGELALVETYLSRCLQQAVSFGSAEVQVFALSGLARLHLALGDPQAAAETYQQIDVLLQQHTFNLSISAYVDYHRFLLLLKQEDVAGAAGWIAAHAGQPGPLNAYALHRLARPQFLLAQGDFAGAQEDLAALVTEAEASGHGAFLLKALVLQALALHLDGRSDQAHETLERALALAEPEGFVRAFVDEGEVLRELLAGYRAAHAARSGPALAEGPRRLPAYAGRLLAAFPPADARSTLASEPHLDPLSEREMEVLLLVATGASNRDIAGELFLAVPTVKKHVSNILSKLNASSRTQAVAEARALGLL